MPDPLHSNENGFSFLRGGGEAGDVIRSFNWNESPIGAVVQWPQSLKSTLNLILNSAFPQLLLWGEELTCFYNDAFTPSLGINGKHPSIGKPAREMWTDIWDFLAPLFSQILQTGQPVKFEDQLVPFFRNGRTEDIYWTFGYSPAYGDDGQIAGIYVICTETTEQVVTRRQLENQNLQLKLSVDAELIAQKRIKENERNLRQVILQAPVAIAIFRGEDYVVEIANGKALELWGRKFGDVAGKPILEALPELKDQGIKPLLDHVYQTGIPFSATEAPMQLNRNGLLETAYINFVYEALYDADGKINGLITIGTDVTTQFLIRTEIEHNQEELRASNEELSEANTELAAAQRHLELMVNDLAATEARFRSLVKAAPVAIGVLHGRNLVVETANDMILSLWGKSKAIIGKPLAVAIPELHGQPYLQLLDDVYTSRQPHYGYEASALLEHDGQLQEHFFNYIYQPLNDEQSADNTIMVVAIEVTAQVNARLELERAYEQARLSKEAAQLGTFDLDLERDVLEWDDRCRELFGITHKGPVEYERDFVNGMHPEDKDRVLKVIAASFKKELSNGDYDVEYRTVGAEDKKLRWVRAKGKVYFNLQDNPVRFIGSVLDITEQKLDELRKNDFIGMVSHELKTPLTTLTAITQVLSPKLKSSADPFVAGALDKANIQVKKMSNMVNGFLNISRLESGKIELHLQSFELNELITEMLEETKMTVSSHRFEFKECAKIMLDADRDKIGSVISNLLSNAVKYSAKGSLVTLACINKNDEVIVRISDEGIGIQAQDIDKLFDRYYRVENKNLAHISGFGIGLYLSAEIIRRHNGRIWAESEEGKGSVFSFALPLLT